MGEVRATTAGRGGGQTPNSGCTSRRGADRRAGFSATTVDDIALRAKVAKGTVYYNFASKTALFEELLRHGIGLLTDAFREAVAGLPPREAVAALVRTQLEYIRRYQAFARCCSPRCGAPTGSGSRP